jgi:hypothetical protein
LQIVVTDPLGEIRYDLYRATEGGQFKLSLPLGLNDPEIALGVAGLIPGRITERPTDGDDGIRHNPTD